MKLTSYGSAFKRFGIAAGLTVAAFSSAFWIPISDLAVVVAIASIFLGLPITILLYRDGLRAVQASHGAAITTTVLSLPIRILGGTSCIAGAAILLWLAYNIFIDRQPQFTGVRTIGQLTLPIILIIFGYRLVRRPLARADDDGQAA